MKNIFISFLFCVASCFAAQAQSKLLPAAEQQNTKALPAFNLDSLITACLADISADSIEHYMRDLQGFGTRFLLSPNNKTVAQFLANKFYSFGYTDVRLDSFPHYSNYFGPITSMQYNVVATLPGTTNQGTYYVAGGHYDSYRDGVLPNDSTLFAPGADDDASGTAATLEIARVFKLHNIQSAATINLVCFAAEEFAIVDTTKSGAHVYADYARNNNDDIGFMINMDMISNNNPGNNLIYLHPYTGNNYAKNMASDVCQQYTALTPYLNSPNEGGVDSYFFWENGYDAIYFEEYNFSPFYHTTGDTVGNYDMQYCVEVAKLSFGSLLKAAYIPRPVDDFALNTINNCNDVRVSWNGSLDEDVTGYNVYFGSVYGMYDSVIFITDTQYIFTNLALNNTYYVGVSALNAGGFESLLREDSVTTALCGFNEGILIVDGSDGGVGTPTDEQIDAFYNDVLFGFHRTEYAADSIGGIDLATLGRYSSVLWHINSATNATSFVNSIKNLKNYLACGGKLLLTVYRPNYTIGQNNTFDLSIHEKGSFIADYLKVNSSQNSVTSYMNSAVPEMILFDTLHCDSSKTGGKMKYVEVLNPTSEAAKLYWYDSPYDTTQSLGELKYKNVGVLYDGSDFKTLTLGFPLYYMKKDEVQSMLRYVFENIFGEVYTGIEENATVSNLQCYPNPVKDVLYVKGAAIDHYTITDVSGRVVLSGIADDNSIQVNKMKPGVYILRTGAAVLLFVKE